MQKLLVAGMIMLGMALIGVGFYAFGQASTATPSAPVGQGMQETVMVTIVPVTPGNFPTMPPQQTREAEFFDQMSSNVPTPDRECVVTDLDIPVDGISVDVPFDAYVSMIPLTIFRLGEWVLFMTPNIGETFSYDIRLKDDKGVHKVTKVLPHNLVIPSGLPRERVSKGNHTLRIVLFNEEQAEYFTEEGFAVTTEVVDQRQDGAITLYMCP